MSAFTRVFDALRPGVELHRSRKAPRPAHVHFAPRTIFNGQFVQIRQTTHLSFASFVIIAFNSVDKAKAWNDVPGQQAVNAVRMKTPKSRAFVVEGM